MINAGHGWHFGLAFGLHWLVMIAAWGLAVWLLFALYRTAARAIRARRTPGEDVALEALRERYARGELSQEAFEAEHTSLREPR